MKTYFYRITGGFILIGIGLLIWLSNLGIFNITWRRDWPVILIIIGALELVKNIIKKR